MDLSRFSASFVILPIDAVQSSAAPPDFWIVPFETDEMGWTTSFQSATDVFHAALRRLRSPP